MVVHTGSAAQGAERAPRSLDPEPAAEHSLRTRNNRAIEIVDEKADEVFRLLTSNKAFTFLPGIQLSEADRAAWIRKTT